jgi:hypothetical protein
MGDTMKNLLTMQQTAKHAMHSPQALGCLRDHGFGSRWINLGRVIRYDSASVEEYVAACGEALDLADLSD